MEMTLNLNKQKKVRRYLLRLQTLVNVILIYLHAQRERIAHEYTSKHFPIDLITNKLFPIDDVWRRL